MHCSMLLSSRRWVSALSGSVRGRISDFRDAHNKRLRQPPKPRANIILRYAPILASALRSLFAVDGVAKPLE
jgi:hypothetical protein